MVFVLSLALWTLSVMLLMASTTAAAFAVAFLGIGAGMGGFQMAAQNMVLEFGAREDLPVRIAVGNSTQELTGAIGLLVAGVLAITFSRDVVYWTAIGFQLAAIVITLLYVDEPRHREQIS
jgi:MFS family permease